MFRFFLIRFKYILFLLFFCFLFIFLYFIDFARSFIWFYYIFGSILFSVLSYSFFLSLFLSTINFWLRTLTIIHESFWKLSNMSLKRRIQKASEIAVFLSCILSYFLVSFILLKARTSVFACSYVCRQVCKNGLELCGKHTVIRRNTVAKEKRNLKNNHLLIHLRQSTTKITGTSDSFYFEKNPFKEI